METNVLLATVPRASVGYSYLAATRWEAIAGLGIPRGFVKNLKAISWESRRHVDTRIKLKLQNDIELNPGPSLAEERKRKRVCRKRKRQEKMVKTTKERVDKMKGKINLMTWNVQKASIDFPRGCRFVEILGYIQKTSVKIVFLSEILSREQGISWIKSRKLFGVVVYGRKTAIFLRDDWAKDWEKQGCQKSDRVVAVKVGKYTLVACYQPIWGNNEGEMRKYREDLEEKLILKRRNE